MLAGFAATDITPPVGSLLNGFIARLSPSTGIDGPLLARALWLEDSGVICLIVGLDVLALPSSFADRIIDKLAARLDLSEERIILASSHTHSGPMTIRVRGIGPADQEYLSVLEEQIVEASVTAAACKKPVKLSWGSAPVEIGVNRRQVIPEDGTVVLGCNPDGPRDMAVRVLHLTGNDLSIILFEHSCHPYYLGSDCSLISPDYWGHAAAVLAEKGHQAIYLNGCSGDLGPQLAFQGPLAAQAEGRRLADAVLSACAQARLEKNPILRIASTRFDLPNDDLPSLAQIERDLAKPDRTVRRNERENHIVRARIKAAWNEWLSDLKQVMAEGAGLPPVTTRISIARIDSGAIVVLPGEVFYEIGRRIATQLEADPVCVAAYCHGYIGYVFDPEALARGGYEVEESHRYTGMWRLSPRAAALLENQVICLWKDLGGQLR